MGIRPVSDLTCTPNPANIPGRVVLELAARPTAGTTAADVVYVIDSSVPVFFVNRNGDLTNTATLRDVSIGPATTRVPFRVELAWGSAGPAPAAFYVDAMVSERGGPGYATGCWVKAVGALNWATMFAGISPIYGLGKPARVAPAGKKKVARSPKRKRRRNK